MSIFLKNLDLSKIKSNQRNLSQSSSKSKSKRLGPTVPFPVKLFQLLSEVDEQGLDYIVSWNGDGRSFQVHEPEKFVQEILPKYFRCSKLKSFQRQLNLYKFTRALSGPQEGSYSHPRFVRGDLNMAKTIKRKSGSHFTDLKYETDSVCIEHDDDVSTSSDKLDEMVLEALLGGKENTSSEQTEKRSRDSLQVFLESNFDQCDAKGQENFSEGTRFSFVGKHFFFLPAEFADL